jgi:aspartate-semialdehyde dehydrogenase
MIPRTMQANDATSENWKSKKIVEFYKYWTLYIFLYAYMCVRVCVYYGMVKHVSLTFG